MQLFKHNMQSPFQILNMINKKKQKSKGCYNIPFLNPYAMQYDALSGYNCKIINCDEKIAILISFIILIEGCLITSNM